MSKPMWLALLIVALGLVPHVALYAVNSTSSAFRVVAVGFGGLGLMSTGVALWGLRGLPRIDSIRASAARWRSLCIGVALVVCVGFGLMMRPEWVYAHTGVTLALLLTVSYGALFDSLPSLSRVAWIGIIAGAAVVTLVRVYSLSYTPNHNVADEGWILGWALSYLRDGYFHDLIIYHGGADIQRFMLPVAWWMSLFGTGFWQVRLFFFVASMLVIVIGALAARNLYGNAWITVFVLFSSSLLTSAATIRHDIGLALAVAASIWLWSEAIKRDKGWLHFLAGMMIGLGMFAHYHAVFMGVALLIGLYAPRIAAARRLERDVILFMVGGMAGALMVVIFQIIPDWQGFLALRRTRSPLGLGAYLETFVRHMINLSVLSVYEFFLITAALIMALWRRTTLSVSLVLLLLISHIGLAIFAGDVVAPQYLVPLSLVYTLLIAGLFQKFASLKWIGAAFFLSIGLGYTIAVPLSHVFQRDPVQLPVLPAATWVRDNVRPDETVVADSFYFVFLTDYTFFSPDTPGYIHLGYRPALEEAAAQIDVSAFADSVANLTPNALRYRTVVWDEISPDVVVIDPNLSSCCIAPIALPAYLESRGYRLVAQFDGETQPVLIYRKNSS